MANPILLLSAEYPPDYGGIASLSDALVGSFDEAGFEVRVISTVPDPEHRSPAVVPTTRTPGFLNRKYLKILPLLLACLPFCLRRRPPFLVLMKCNHEGVAGYLLHRLTGVRYAMVAHGSEILVFRRNRWTNRFIQILMDRADKILANSTYTRDLAVESFGVDPQKISIIHPIVAAIPEPTDEGLNDLRRKYELEGKRVLLTVARLCKRKGHDMVLRALAALRTDYPDLVYVIAGKGSDRPSIERLIDELGIGDIVRLVGSVPSDDVDALYRCCEIFVMPSRQEGDDIEGFGIAFLEASLRCKPVVGGRCGGVPDAVADGETGLLVDPNDWKDVARAMRVLLDDPALGLRLGRAGRERVLELFSRRQQTEQLTQLGNQLGLLDLTPTEPISADGTGQS